MVTSHSNDGAVHLSVDMPARHAPLDGFPEPPPWIADAVCTSTDPEAFFPEKGGSTREAKAICRSCTVQAECLDWALDRDERFVGPPDEIRILINTAKGHPSKRIQAQANKVLDAIGRLRDLIAEDEAKHAERRAEDAQKAPALPPRTPAREKSTTATSSTTSNQSGDTA
jgi:hypothetical protein